MNPHLAALSLSCHASPLLLSTRAVEVRCSLPSPKPRTIRPNYLRRKTLIPRPQPLQSPPPPPPPPPSLPPPSEQLPPDELRFVALEEEMIVVERVGRDVDAAEIVEEAAVAAVGTDLLTSPSDFRLLPREVVGLALRFAALIAVQTAVAVWFLGGVKDQGRDGGSLSEEVELKKKVLEIRAMAKEARENERREVAEHMEDSGVQREVEKKLSRYRNSATKVILDENVFSVSLPVPSKNVDDGTNREKNNSKQKIGREKMNSKGKKGFLNSTKRTASVPKGFSGPRSNRERGKDGSGGVEQTAEGASRHHDQVDIKACASGTTQGLSDIKDFAASSSGAIGRISNGHHINASRILEETASEGKLSYGENYFSSDDNELLLKNPSGESSVEAIRTSSTEGRKANRRNEHRSFINKDEENHMLATNRRWWLKLPYVMAILLRRGADDGGPKGLYSLEMNSSIGQEKASYTIVFQDRQDATNFCYLLESFFDDLGDVTADAVPLTIEELEQAVKSEALKVIVVRKGQLRLYAGQPLVDVETEIRSLID